MIWFASGYILYNSDYSLYALENLVRKKFHKKDKYKKRCVGCFKRAKFSRLILNLIRLPPHFGVQPRTVKFECEDLPWYENWKRLFIASFGKTAEKASLPTGFALLIRRGYRAYIGHLINTIHETTHTEVELKWAFQHNEKARAHANKYS